MFESLLDRARVLQWNEFVWLVVNLKWVSGVRDLGGNGKIFESLKLLLSNDTLNISPSVCRRRTVLLLLSDLHETLCWK